MFYSAMLFLGLNLTMSSLSVPTDQPPLPCLDGEVLPPVLALKLIAPDNAHGKKIIQVRLIISNKSPAPAHNVTLTFVPPKGVKFLRSHPVAGEKDKEYIWKASRVAGFAQEQVIVELGIETQADFESCFKLNYEHGICAKTKPSCAPPEAGRNPKVEEGSKDNRTTTRQASLMLTKSIPDHFREDAHPVGRPIPFSITVTNNGNLPINDVTIIDQLDKNVNYIDLSATDGQAFSISPNRDKLEWKLGQLKPGDVRRVEFKAQVKEAGQYVNRAIAQGLAPNGEVVRTNPAEIPFNVAGIANLYMEVVDSVDPIFIAGKTTYLIRIRNSGTAPANNIVLRTKIPEGLSNKTIVESGIGEPKVLSNEQIDSVNRTKDIVFAPFTLPSKTSKLFQITIEARSEGYFRIRAILNSDALNRVPLEEIETTNVVNEIPVDSR